MRHFTKQSSQSSQTILSLSGRKMAKLRQGLVAPPEKKDVTFFPTQIAMLQPVSYVCEDGLKMHFVKTKSLVMKANHLLATYGGIFVTVLNVEKKKLLKKIIQEEEIKNPLKKSSKKDRKQVIQKLID